MQCGCQCLSLLFPPKYGLFITYVFENSSVQFQSDLKNARFERSDLYNGSND
jgi:hypothetical protein